MHCEHSSIFYLVSNSSRSTPHDGCRSHVLPRKFTSVWVETILPEELQEAKTELNAKMAYHLKDLLCHDEVRLCSC